MSSKTITSEVAVKEKHDYEWTCPACEEEVFIRSAVLKCTISCPICGLTYVRSEISSDLWQVRKEWHQLRAPRIVELDMSMRR